MDKEALLAGEPERIRPKAAPELSPEERNRRDDDETRRGFAVILARAKAGVKTNEEA